MAGIRTGIVGSLPSKDCFPGRIRRASDLARPLHKQGVPDRIAPAKFVGSGLVPSPLGGTMDPGWATVTAVRPGSSPTSGSGRSRTGVLFSGE